MHRTTRSSGPSRRTLATLAAVAAVAASLSGLPAAQASVPTGQILFPTDRLTVADPAQLTGRRVNLPMPGSCAENPAGCDETRLLNTLDGFDVDPRIAIGLASLPDEGIAEAFGEEVLHVRRIGTTDRIGLNRFVLDPTTRTLYGHPVRQLREGTTYELVYAPPTGRRSATFTTMSTTRVLVQLRDQLDSGAAYTAAGVPEGERTLSFTQGEVRTVFAAATVARVTRLNDKSSKPAVAPVREDVINAALVAAGTYGFGSFLSPSWLDRDRTIPATATRSGAPKVLGLERVGVTVVLPLGPKPAGGWPTVIFAPGITRSKYDIFLAADLNAARGLATVAFDPVGHAFGPRSAVEVQTLTAPAPVTFSGFGRGRDLDRDGEITDQEGSSAPVQPHPSAAIGLRDGLRQTAADLMALVRAIGRGADVDGDGATDLRPTGVGLYAQSLGSIYGTQMMGVDPLVKTALLNVGGGPIADIARLSPGFRGRIADSLRDRRPALLNGGINGFTESTPLYLDPPVTEPAPCATAIQAYIATSNWLNRPGSPESYAPRLRLEPFPGVPAKRVALQFAFGDATVPNATSATIMRAGGLADVTSYYRNDRTVTASSNPHGFLLDPRLQGREQGQLQAVQFLVADGAAAPVDPDGPGPTWETPIADVDGLERVNVAASTYAAPTGAPPRQMGCVLAARAAAGAAPGAARRPAPLPATGLPWVIPAVAAAALGAGVGLRRRRRQH